MELVITGYTMDNNNVVGIDYFLNGEVTDQATYDTAFAPYLGEERSILISNFSEKNMVLIILAQLAMLVQSLPPRTERK